MALVRWRTRLCLGGLASGGVAAAHWLAYLLAVPDPHQRAAVLESTGHGYWDYLVAIALGLFVVAAATFVGRASSGQPRTERFASTALRLALIQVPVFLLMETAERAFLGQGGLVFTEPVVVLGVLLQVLGALAGALLLAGLERVVRFIRKARTRTSRSQITRNSSSRAFVPALELNSGGASWRGPPPLRL